MMLCRRLSDESKLIFQMDRNRYSLTYSGKTITLALTSDYSLSKKLVKKLDAYNIENLVLYWHCVDCFNYPEFKRRVLPEFGLLAHEQSLYPTFVLPQELIIQLKRDHRLFLAGDMTKAKNWNESFIWLVDRGWGDTFHYSINTYYDDLLFQPCYLQAKRDSGMQGISNALNRREYAKS